VSESTETACACGMENEPTVTRVLLSSRETVLEERYSHSVGSATSAWPYYTSGAGQPPNAPDANPARPTVSTPATLTPVGYLQFENGVLYAIEFA
jgi:hypothetical protein